MQFELLGPNHYRLALSKRDTQAWAARPHSRWPNSQFAGRSVTVVVDATGLCEILCRRTLVSVADVELRAIISDFQPPIVQHLWPSMKGTP